MNRLPKFLNWPISSAQGLLRGYRVPLFGTLVLWSAMATGGEIDRTETASPFAVIAQTMNQLSGLGEGTQAAPVSARGSTAATTNAVRFGRQSGVSLGEIKSTSASNGSENTASDTAFLHKLLANQDYDSSDYFALRTLNDREPSLVSGFAEEHPAFAKVARTLYETFGSLDGNNLGRESLRALGQTSRPIADELDSAAPRPHSTTYDRSTH